MMTDTDGLLKEAHKSPEQKARDMLARMGVGGAQAMTAGDVAELANLIVNATTPFRQLVESCTPISLAKLGESWTDGADTVQVGGDHYKRMKVQPWAAMEAWMTHEQFVGFLLGTAIAYLGRFNSEGDSKGGLVDVEKSGHVLDKLAEVLRAAMVPCDGEHHAPACDAPHCWQR